MAECQHQWKSDGGRGCPKHNTHEDMVVGSRMVYTTLGWHREPVYCDQVVFRCAKCGEYDYGDPGGLGYDQCQNYCPLDHPEQVQ